MNKINFINPNSEIGKDTIVEPFSYIDKNVIIGNNCWIGNNVTIYSGARIGDNVKIFPGAVISSVPQDLKFDGEETLVEIGEGTTIRECVTISRGTKDKFKTTIGKNCLLMAYSHIAHDCIIEDNCIIVNGVQIAGHTIIGEFAIIGGGTLIHQFTKIGCHSMISGGSIIRKDVPPYCKAGKEPLAYKGVNSIGLKRRNFSQDQINQIQNMYRILYLEGKNISQALKKISEEITKSNERETLVEFIRLSERGVIKGFLD